MTTYRCDRCKNISDNPVKITITSRDPYSDDPHYDICEECYNALFQ